MLLCICLFYWKKFQGSRTPFRQFAFRAPFPHRQLANNHLLSLNSYVLQKILSYVQLSILSSHGGYFLVNKTFIIALCNLRVHPKTHPIICRLRIIPFLLHSSKHLTNSLKMQSNLTEPPCFLKRPAV